MYIIYILFPHLLYLEVVPGGVQGALQLQDLLCHLTCLIDQLKIFKNV